MAVTEVAPSEARTHAPDRTPRLYRERGRQECLRHLGNPVAADFSAPCAEHSRNREHTPAPARRYCLSTTNRATLYPSAPPKNTSDAKCVLRLIRVNPIKPATP